jgi:hypothetical protein
MAAKDQLYLLRPGFMNAAVGPLYCSDSAPVEGVLSFFPNLRTLIDVHYIEFPRPRAILVEALGEEYQGVPVLIMAPGRNPRQDMPAAKRARGRVFLNDERSIRQYLSLQYALPMSTLSVNDSVVTGQNCTLS